MLSSDRAQRDYTLRAAATLSLWWQREAIDWPALPRLTRAPLGRGRHSRLSPDGIYYVLCFNVRSARVEINFSLGPNCLCALAAEGRPALSRRSPRRIAQLYFKPNYTHPRAPARAAGLWGVIQQRTGLTVAGSQQWLCCVGPTLSRSSVGGNLQEEDVLVLTFAKQNKIHWFYGSSF